MVQEDEAPRFQCNRYMKMVRLSAVRTGRRDPHEVFLVLISVQRPSQPQGHSAAGRIVSVKISSDTIENRTRDFPACSIVIQPTAPLRAPSIHYLIHYLKLQTIYHDSSAKF
jgi:hypothetical protein